MATFDSPVLLCDVCGEVVLRDTTWKDCARAHHCPIQRCPYKNEFLDQGGKTQEQSVAGLESGGGSFTADGDSLNEDQRPDHK